MSPTSSFRSIENKHGVYRDNDYMKKFCEFVREYAMKIINYKKKKQKIVNKSGRNYMKMQKSVIFLKKKLKINIWKIKNIVKLEINVITHGNVEVLHIAYVI